MPCAESSSPAKPAPLGKDVKTPVAALGQADGATGMQAVFLCGLEFALAPGIEELVVFGRAVQCGGGSA